MRESTSVQPDLNITPLDLASTVPSGVIGGVLAAGLVLVAASLVSGLALRGIDPHSSTLLRAVQGISSFIVKIVAGLGDSRSRGRGRRFTGRPVNWNQLSADDAEQEWLALNQWVEWLRYTYQLPDSVLPSHWHRHAGLVWELSALYSAWTNAYGSKQAGTAPLRWHREFADARDRLREWAAATDTGDALTTNRDADFLILMADDVNRRRVTENAA